MSDPSSSPEPKLSKAFSSELIKDCIIHSNVKQEVIIVTSDRLELCLRKHLDSVAAKGAWITPASLFITFVATLCASTFHNAFGLSAAVWEAMFILLSLASAIWLACAIWRAKNIRTSLETLIKEVKKISDMRVEQDQ
ncbi:MAG TPA: hypothetical protein VF345_04440 [Chthoniobacterales bacterium]